MISLLEHEFVARRQWLTQEDFLDMVAIAESTPGPAAVNSATYIGYHIAGFGGALMSTTAVCLPSFTIIYIISLFFDAFLQLSWVANAFKGIQVCVVYLIFSAGIRMLKGLDRTLFNVVIVMTVMTLMVLLSLFAVSFSSIVYILISGCAGLMIYYAARPRRGGHRH